MKIDLFVANPDAYVRERYPFNVGRIATSLIDRLTDVVNELGFGKQITANPEDYKNIDGLNDLELFVNLGDLFKTDKNFVYHLHINKNRRFIEVTLDNRHVDETALTEETLFKLQKFNAFLNTFLFEQAKRYGLNYYSKLSEVIAPRMLYSES